MVKANSEAQENSGDKTEKTVDGEQDAGKGNKASPGGATPSESSSSKAKASVNISDKPSKGRSTGKSPISEGSPGSSSDDDCGSETDRHETTQQKSNGSCSATSVDNTSSSGGERKVFKGKGKKSSVGNPKPSETTCGVVVLDEIKEEVQEMCNGDTVEMKDIER